jgi:hypothetical protein
MMHEPAFCSGSRVGCDALDARLVFTVAAAFVELSTDKIDLSEDPFSSA